MSFQSVAVRKDGHDDRLAKSPVELVQFEHDGWVAVKDEPKAPEKPRVPAPPAGQQPPQFPPSQ